MRYLITGKNGQLACEFSRFFEEKGIDYLAPGEDLLDITNPIHIRDVIDSFRPDVVLNCAAYNLVDKAEAEKDLAEMVNALGPKYLAQEAESHKALLVHFGSDYVFDGEKQSGLYCEDDTTNPINEYGKSKLAGELHIQHETDRYLIFRVSWLYGTGKQNFIHKILEWAKTQEYLRVACDEFSVPTYTQTVVSVAIKAIDQGLTGLLHLTNTGFCSRYDWGRLVLSLAGIDKFVRPVSIGTFDSLARRPSFSPMTNQKLSQLLSISIPVWDESVKTFMRNH